MSDHNKSKVNIMGICKGAHYITYCLIIIIIVSMLAAVVCAGKNFAVFKIREHFSGDIVYQRMVRVGDEFTLHYVHSVTKRPVDEVFKIDNRHELALVEMRYDSFGANLPVGSELLSGEKTDFIVEKDFYRISYQNRKFDVVPLRVGQVIADHAVKFADGPKVRLLDITQGGEYIELYVEPLIN